MSEPTVDVSAGDDATEGAPVERPAEHVAPAPTSRSAAALARYGTDLRRRRIVNFSVLAVVLLGLGTFVGVAWSRGEVAHASLHTFHPPPARLALSSPSAGQQEAWHTTDRLADGVPQWGGTVITFSKHTVGGRDARTGKRTWTYTRTDRTICAAGQAGGTTIAAFESRGNCDELDAFYSGSGSRRWTRTLDFDGIAVTGRPAFQTTPVTLVATTSFGIYAIDPVTGYNRWTYHRNGCRIGSAVLGSAGALISQSCSPQVACSGQKFCARGPQLILRDRDAGTDDKSKDNADKIKWIKVGDPGIPVSADAVVSSVSRDGSGLSLLDPGTGREKRRLDLTPESGQLGAVSAVATSDGEEVIWLSGRTYAVRSGSARPRWSVGTLAAPTVVSRTGGDPATLATARLTVPTTTGIAVLYGTSGHVSRRFGVSAPATGSRVYPSGAGFLVGTPSGVMAYR